MKKLKTWFAKLFSTGENGGWAMVQVYNEDGTIDNEAMKAAISLLEKRYQIIFL